jgi:hypothetical protein
MFRKLSQETLNIHKGLCSSLGEDVLKHQSIDGISKPSHNSKFLYVPRSVCLSCRFYIVCSGATCPWGGRLASTVSIRSDKRGFVSLKLQITPLMLIHSRNEPSPQLLSSSSALVTDCNRSSWTIGARRQDYAALLLKRMEETTMAEKRPFHPGIRQC